MRATGIGLLLLLTAMASVDATEAPSPLSALFEEVWQFQLQEDPLFASSTGDHRYDDRLPSLTRADFERRAAFYRRTLERLAGFDRAALATGDRVSYDMLQRKLRDELAELDFGTHRMPITAEGGFHTSFARLPAETNFLAVEDYDNYLARLRAFPALLDQQVALMREGLAAGFTPPRAVFAGFETTITTHVVDDVAKSVFWQPFTSFPATLPAAERQRLSAAGRQAIEAVVIPAYRKFLDFMTREYIPGARTTIGASEWPRGRELYAHLVRHFTTLDLTPGQIHELGLQEVARIRAEMQAVIDQVGFEGTFAEFVAFLRTDPRFYPKSGEELLKQASYIAKRMDGKLPSLFKRLPRQPYGVEPVPPDLAPKYTAGRYVEAPSDSTRAGTYWVNTYALESRPLYALEALSLHEAVPGHHLQIALQRELEGVPAFRRFTYVNSFGEGWGLYSERLGLEAGFYTDPYSNFGRLTYEMWRACRLVVDTGLHAFGWTRQQAMDYLAGNTALSLHEVETETDRYISWPGQALSYKMGELKIRELRKRAEEALGERFDVRDFHDTVLANGSVPLTVLEDQIDAYIAAARR